MLILTVSAEIARRAARVFRRLGDALDRPVEVDRTRHPDVRIGLDDSQTGRADIDGGHDLVGVAKAATARHIGLAHHGVTEVVAQCARRVDAVHLDLRSVERCRDYERAAVAGICEGGKSSRLVSSMYSNWTETFADVDPFSPDTVSGDGWRP